MSIRIGDGGNGFPPLGNVKEDQKVRGILIFGVPDIKKVRCSMDSVASSWP